MYYTIYCVNTVLVHFAFLSVLLRYYLSIIKHTYFQFIAWVLITSGSIALPLPQSYPAFFWQFHLIHSRQTLAELLSTKISFANTGIWYKWDHRLWAFLCLASVSIMFLLHRHPEIHFIYGVLLCLPICFAASSIEDFLLIYPSVLQWMNHWPVNLIS